MATARNDFRVEGLKELVKAFDDFPDIAREEMQTKVDEAGEFLLQKTKEKVPVRSGALRDSLHLKKPRSKKWVMVNILTWGNDVREYAAPVELGHRLVYFGKRTLRSVAPRPFLRPAVDENREKIFDIITSGIDKALAKLGGIQ